MRRIIICHEDIIAEIKREVAYLEGHTRPKDDIDAYDTDEAWQSLDWLLTRLDKMQIGNSRLVGGER
jgi:hypothetical protein